MAECAPSYNRKASYSCIHSFMNICGCPWVCRKCGISFSSYAYRDRIAKTPEELDKACKLEEEVEKLMKEIK